MKCKAVPKRKNRGGKDLGGKRKGIQWVYVREKAQNYANSRKIGKIHHLRGRAHRVELKYFHAPLPLAPQTFYTCCLFFCHLFFFCLTPLLFFRVFVTLPRSAGFHCSSPPSTPIPPAFPLTLLFQPAQKQKGLEREDRYKIYTKQYVCRTQQWQIATHGKQARDQRTHAHTQTSRVTKAPPPKCLK